MIDSSPEAQASPMALIVVTQGVQLKKRNASASDELSL